MRQWDDEELERGRRRDKNGTWSGAPPAIVPKAVHDELVRRKLAKGYGLLADNIAAAVAVLVEVATDTKADAGVRVKAATAILDRAMPKLPQAISFQLNPEPAPWQKALSGGISSVEAIIEAYEANGASASEPEPKSILAPNQPIE